MKTSRALEDGVPTLVETVRFDKLSPEAASRPAAPDAIRVPGSANAIRRFVSRLAPMVWAPTVSVLALTMGAIFTPASVRAQAPDEDWRTFETPHFVVTFPLGLEDIARRAGDRAERAYAELSESFVDPPEGKIDLIVTDHVDRSNGFATLFPSNRITLFARPPVDVISLQYFDDWMETLITHELVHTFHLDRTSRFGRLLRSVMGRYPTAWPLFPEVNLPTWTIEGMATYYESALTESGRTSGTYHEMILRTAALENRFERLDQVAGFSPLWPAGTRPYIYGSKFFEYLAEARGPEAMGEFVDATAGLWIPFRVNAAARESFGTAFTDEWDGFRESYVEAGRRLAEAAQSSDLPSPESVVADGRFAFHPQVSPDGSTLALARSDGSSNTQLRAVAILDGDARPLTRTNGFATFSWAPDGSIVFHQIEDVDPYRARNDLYRLWPDGRVTRITQGERLSHPSVDPAGDFAVAVQDGGGASRLVEVDMASGGVRPLTESRVDELWTSPRISPNGEWIATSRWRPGALLDVVIIDRTGDELIEVTADRAIDTSPWWSPDGHALIWTSDRSGVANLYGASVDPATGAVGQTRQITDLATGAAYPSIDPAGDWIYFSAYHADGWHVERVPFEMEAWVAAAPLDTRFGSGGRAAADRYEERAEGPSRTYSAGRSLLPRYWEPLFTGPQNIRGTDVVGPSVGVGIAGRDLVNRHAYAVGIYYEPEFGRVQGGATYSFAGFGVPTLTLSTGQFYDADPAAVQVDDSTTRPLFIVDREQQLFATLRFPRPRQRTFTSLSVTGGLVRSLGEVREPDLTISETVRLNEPEHSLIEGRASLVLSNVQGHAYSISGEDGLSLSVTGRTRAEPGLSAESRGVPGRDDSLDEVIGVARAFKAFPGPGFSRHTLAFRVSAGAARGPGANRFHYDLGGVAGQSEGITGLGLFGGSRLLLPVRGYAEDVRSGRFAWTGSAEYRFPIAWIHRGLGPFPLYFDRISGSVFVDAGDAWGSLDGFEPANPRRGALIGAGGELTVRLAPFWLGSLDVRVGVGAPLTEGRGTQAWVRLGRAF